MIEISDREYWKRFNWYDALLYCSMLEIDGKNDWRMMTFVESQLIYDDYLDNNLICGYWLIEDKDREFWIDELYYMVPVRDV